MASKELILTFLGTGAMRPAFRRGSRRLCVRYFLQLASAIGAYIPTMTGSENWLFDCGEGEYTLFENLMYRHV